MTRIVWALVALCAIVAGALVGASCGSSGRPVTVDIAEISDDCWYEVGHRDRDGLPGGPTDPRTEIHCP